MSAEESDLSFQERALFQQGYQSYSVRELRQLDWGLRFTPVLCLIMAVLGVVLWIKWVPFVVAALGIWSFFFPTGHPFDILYNRVVRHAFGAAALPPAPLQRRLACLSAGGMNIAIGVFMVLDMPLPAYLVVGVLAVLQAIVITSHLCVLSVMYEGVLRLFGKWRMPLAVDQVKRLLEAGATVVDVRTASEFAKDHLPNAINVPVDDVVAQADVFREGTFVLYCASGFRSHIATEKLKAEGLQEVYNAGASGRLKPLWDADLNLAQGHAV